MEKVEPKAKATAGHLGRQRAGGMAEPMAMNLVESKAIATATVTAAHLVMSRAPVLD